MKAIVIHDVKDLRIEEQDCPAPAANEVQVQIATGGVCGSDLHYYNHGGFGTVKLREPMILGHEVAGHVRAIGADVNNSSVSSPNVRNPHGGKLPVQVLPARQSQSLP